MEIPLKYLDLGWKNAEKYGKKMGNIWEIHGKNMEIPRFGVERYGKIWKNDVQHVEKKQLWKGWYFFRLAPGYSWKSGLALPSPARWALYPAGCEDVWEAPNSGHEKSTTATTTTHLVGGWATPLKNMKVNWDDEIPNINGKIKNVPNHQPVIEVVLPEIQTT